MRYATITTLLLLGGAGTTAAQEEEAGQVRVLSLDECVAIALENNPGLAIAAQRERASEAGLQGAASAYFPRVEVRSSYQLTRSRGGRRVIPGVGVIQFAGQIAEPDVHGLYLTQTILQTGRTDAVRQARHEARADKHATADVRRELIDAVAAQYYVVLANRRLLEVAQESAAFEDENVRIVQGRIDVGAAAPVDVRPALTRRAQAQLEVVRAENAVELALAQLKNIIGLPPTSRIDVAESLQEEAREVNLEDALQEAYERRPDLAEQEERVRAAKYALRIARARALPQLVVTGESAYDLLDAVPAFTYEFAASARYPIFDGGSARAEVDAAKANLRAAKAQLEQVRLTVGLEVENAVLSVREAAARIQAARTAVQEAQANFEAMQGRLQEGLVTTQDVTEAEVALTNARVQEVQAIYDLNVALTALDAAIGRQ